uniref:Uncharacterized protein n=1 Tax=Nelumbo nucifera TaxID=4432 RepID=A0A822ZUU3_NELNU|nr:TPA_asm: hypothetical protein HUJ06_016996 [Nelumbo nucifera]
MLSSALEPDLHSDASNYESIKRSLFILISKKYPYPNGYGYSQLVDSSFM